VSSSALHRALQALIGDAGLIYVDCGARKGRAPRPFRALKNVVYIGIDADAAECARLNASARPRHQYIPATLGRCAEPRTFRVTHSPACASLLEPDHAFLSQFGELANGFHVEREIAVATVPLDDCLAAHRVPRADFLELDTQGSELEILAGAERALHDTVVGIQTEVEFAPMYVRQPLFADVDAFLRARGFQLFDLSRYRARRGAVDAAVSTRGQLLWGHALYLRDYRTLSPPMAARLAAVAALLDIPDLAMAILDDLSGSAPQDGERRAARRAREVLRRELTPGPITRLIDRFGGARWSQTYRRVCGFGEDAELSASRQRATWRS